jgi:hypothetical protein
MYVHALGQPRGKLPARQDSSSHRRRHTWQVQSWEHCSIMWAYEGICSFFEQLKKHALMFSLSGMWQGWIWVRCWLAMTNRVEVRWASGCKHGSWVDVERHIMLVESKTEVEVIGHGELGDYIIEHCIDHGRWLCPLLCHIVVASRYHQSERCCIAWQVPRLK